MRGAREEGHPRQHAGALCSIEHRLLTRGLVRRYDTAETADGLPAGEGAFLACSFWLADAYIMLGRVDDARHLFEHLLHVGPSFHERNPAGKLTTRISSSSLRRCHGLNQ